MGLGSLLTALFLVVGIFACDNSQGEGDGGLSSEVRGRSAGAGLVAEAIELASSTYGSLEEVERAIDRRREIHASLLKMGEAGLRDLVSAIEIHQGEKVYPALLGYLAGFRGPAVQRMVYRAMSGDPSREVMQAISEIVMDQGEDWSLWYCQKLSYSTDATVRANAVGGLRYWRREDVSGRLITLIGEDPDKAVRRNAVLAMGSGALVGQREELRALCGAADAVERDVASAAEGVLLRIIDPQAITLPQVDSGSEGGEWTRWVHDVWEIIRWDEDRGHFVVD